MKKILLTVLIILLIVLPIGACVYDYYHPTYWKYNDRFVVGNNLDTVQNRYGKFDFYYYDNENDKICCGYSIKQNLQTPDGRVCDIGYVIYVDAKTVCVGVQKTIVYMERAN